MKNSPDSTTHAHGIAGRIAAAFIDSMRADAQRAGDKVLPAFTGAEYLKAVQAQTIPPSLGAPKGTKNMEGLQFPATYELKYAATATDFVAKQRAAFEDTMAGLDMTKAKAANLTPYELFSRLQTISASTSDSAFNLTLIWLGSKMLF